MHEFSFRCFVFLIEVTTRYSKQLVFDFAENESGISVNKKIRKIQLI